MQFYRVEGKKKQAEWNNITWGTSGNQMAHLKSFKISQKLKLKNKKTKKPAIKPL